MYNVQIAFSEKNILILWVVFTCYYVEWQFQFKLNHFRVKWFYSHLLILKGQENDWIFIGFSLQSNSMWVNCL